MDLFNKVFGCWHSRWSFPQRKGDSAYGFDYVVCLDCGQEREYNFSAMAMGDRVDIKRPHLTAGGF